MECELVLHFSDPPSEYYFSSCCLFMNVKPEASPIVPNIIIFVYSSSSNFLPFCLILVPLLFFYLFASQRQDGIRINKDDCYSSITTTYSYFHVVKQNSAIPNFSKAKFPI